ncbi:MAG: hypothetical protein ICV71_01960 [Thermoleophilia bacterium]|nr:hypothetical protein [Thermoleophilia bacterium]MDQ3858162.1 hypothetical protein [Actinomycetota bacterium]
MADGKLLSVYLNDHLAGASLGIELTRRSLRSNRGTELGRFLEELLAEIVEDRDALETAMGRLGVRKSRVKPAFAVAVERVGRFKLNGRLTGYSPLSRVLELEGLTLGIHGKLSLWRNLRTSDVARRIPDLDLERLIERAESQLRRVEEHRLAAARVAFAGK